MKIVKKLTALFLVLTAVFSTNLTVRAAPAIGATCYVETNTSCKNSNTGSTYRAVNTIKYLTVRNDGQVCYCIEPGKVFTRTLYKAEYSAKN